MTRIFVGNLPADIAENEVEQEFGAYGTVNRVEVKHKRDPVSDEIMSTFAFVTINITDTLLDQCLHEFKTEQFRGRYLTVSVARENFMDKLKREREESTQPKQSPVNHGNYEVNIRPASTKNPFASQTEKNNKIVRTFDSDDESNVGLQPTIDEAFLEPDSCVRKKSKSFTENGKIKIPSFHANGSSIQADRQKSEPKKFDEKSEKADKKRIESLINMKNTYNQQKKMVQQALANVSSNQNKKIVFDEPSTAVTSGKTSSKSNRLFDDEDADDDDGYDYQKSFELKKEYEGEKGARLQKLQSRFQADQRFKMNENFLEDDDEGDNEPVENPAEPQDDERKWQYDMLESVIGKKLQPDVKKKSDNLMLRYDPTKNDHEKYEKVAKRKAKRDSDAVPAKHAKMNDEIEFQVSKEQFFNVTNHLTSALKPSSEGFSLLSMFGRDNDAVETKQPNPYKEITLKGQPNNIPTHNGALFRDDSSDDEIISERLNQSQKNPPPQNDAKAKKAKKNSKSEMWHEPFFIFGSDQRLLDGVAFFLPNETSGTGGEEFESKQKEMRNIIKRKIKKSIKKVLPRGAKPNKRFGRMVRDINQ